MKVVCGLGNPGPEYDDTRHNVGWWLADRLAVDWKLGPFRRRGPAFEASGVVGVHDVLLLKPQTYMNRSGAALAALRRDEDFDPARDLLVVVDDAAIDVGRLRFRPSGSAGGHNGLKSVEAALGTRDYARLRIGVGPVPPGVDMADFVLSPMDRVDEEAVLERLDIAVEGVRTWLDEGIEAAMSRHNG
ncbi:MAG TPA: aminoacyl-tRNA hydrolase [Longimicrobiales bacterium]|nr:aminoacyl-tRNA hydrolase [Longimicrobiales bacterium]